MQQHIILVGTDKQIEKSNFLNMVMDVSQSVSIVSLDSKSIVDDVFCPSNFAAHTDTILVYTNGHAFDYEDFYLFYASTYFFDKNKIDIIFITENMPFDSVNFITQYFRVLRAENINLVKRDPNEQLSIYQIENKINIMLGMIKALHASRNFTADDKLRLLPIYRDFLKHYVNLRSNKIQETANDIISAL